MTTLKFENGDLPEESRTYVADIPEGQDVNAAVKSMEDSGWTLAEREDENAADSKSASKTRKAQSAPTSEGK